MERQLANILLNAHSLEINKPHIDIKPISSGVFATLLDNNNEIVETAYASSIAKAIKSLDKHVAHKVWMKTHPMEWLTGQTE
jgi:hypothetical protein